LAHIWFQITIAMEKRLHKFWFSLRLCVFELGAGTGRTDGRTDGRTGRTRNAACHDSRTINANYSESVCMGTSQPWWWRRTWRHRDPSLISLQIHGRFTH